MQEPITWIFNSKTYETEKGKFSAQPANGKLKPFAFASGITIKAPAYQPKAPTGLPGTHGESQLVVSNAGFISGKAIPTFKYINVNRTDGTCGSDMIIPGKNQIIKAKGRWWYDGNQQYKCQGPLANNLSKQPTALYASCKFEF